MYYKVVSVDNGELYSGHIVGKYCVKYIPGVPVQTPIGRLFVHDALEKAAYYYNAIAIGKPYAVQVWECKVTQPSSVRMVPWLRQEDMDSLAMYWNGSRMKHYAKWPWNSMVSILDAGILVKTVTLVSQVPYEVVWDAGGFVLPEASDVS